MFVAGDTETVWRLRPPAKDAFGDRVAGATDELEISGCLFAPAGSTESAPGSFANTVDSPATVYTPPGIDVLPTDKLRIRGQLYEVLGEPQQWGFKGCVVNIRRVTG